MDKIAIIITTFLRDDLLKKAVESVYKNLPDENYELIIIDQNSTEEKRKEYSKFNYYSVPFNSGLSYGRNFGVEKAKELECDYILISSDSFLCNHTLNNLDIIKEIIDTDEFDLIGFELNNCKCGWEAYLSLDCSGFELDFIEKDKQELIHKCDIIRNFFLARTDSLLDVKWDDNLKLCEHECFFWRYKKKGYKVGWTDLIVADKMTDRPHDYSTLRKVNFNEGLIYLKKKYKILGWVSYNHLDRAKRILDKS